MMSRLCNVNTVKRMLADTSLALLLCIFPASIGNAAQGKDSTQAFHAKPGKNCAKNYKAALSLSHKRYAPRLKYAVKISHSKVGSFPGHWITHPSLTLGNQQKKLSKRQRRRSKHGIRLATLKSPRFSVQHYTAQEQQILRIADSVIRWRGKDPAFNKRGRYGWLTTRIAADLRVYMEQPDHPALCTGANLMMNHLYNNSGRFRKRVALVKKLSPLAHQYAAARYRALKYIIQDGKAPLFVKLGSTEKYASLNGLMTKTAKLLADSRLLPQLRQEQGFLPTIEILRKFTALENGQKKNGSSYKSQKRDILSKIMLPVRRPENIAQGKRKPTQKVKIRTVFVHKETRAVVGNFLHSTAKLSPLAQKALRKSLAAIEAAYYIDHIYQSYDALSTSIYGAISSVKQSHATHCICSE